MDLHLSDDQVKLLVRELDRTIKGIRYPLLPRVQALRAIRAMLKPYSERPTGDAAAGIPSRRVGSDIAGRGK